MDSDFGTSYFWFRPFLISWLGLLGLVSFDYLAYLVLCSPGFQLSNIRRTWRGACADMVTCYKDDDLQGWPPGCEAYGITHMNILWSPGLQLFKIRRKMNGDTRGYGNILLGRPSMMIFRMRCIWYNPHEHSMISWTPALQHMVEPIWAFFDNLGVLWFLFLHFILFYGLLP